MSKGKRKSTDLAEEEFRANMNAILNEEDDWDTTFQTESQNTEFGIGSFGESSTFRNSTGFGGDYPFGSSPFCGFGFFSEVENYTLYIPEYIESKELIKANIERMFTK